MFLFEHAPKGEPEMHPEIAAIYTYQVRTVPKMYQELVHVSFMGQRLCGLD